jgi:hypothetical protein
LTFHNKSNAAIEANFSFRADEATVYAFEVEISGNKIVGQCKAKEKALNDYDDAISAGGRGFLLEKQDSGVFNLALGNLGPDDHCKVSIRYVEDVKVDEKSNAVVVIPIVAMAPDKGLAECTIVVLDHVKSVVSFSQHTLEQKEEEPHKKTVVTVTGSGLQRELRLLIEFTESGLPFPVIEEDKNTTAISIAFVPNIQMEEDPMTEVVFLVCFLPFFLV